MATDLINEYTSDGSIHVYQKMYSVIDGKRTQLMDGSDNKSTGFWLYKPTGSNSGTIEYYFHGQLVERNTVQRLSPTHMTMTISYANPQYAEGAVGTVFEFKKF